MDEFFTRAMLVKNRVDGLYAEATSADCSLARQEAIRDEMAVCEQSLRQIREEQLISLLPKPKRRPWWRRLAPEGSDG